ncbi:MAG: alpha/beta fold hydrolase [Acidimicrobiia bacterium]
MANRKNIGLAVALGVGALIVLSGDFDGGPPINPVDCDGVEASSRRVTCFEVPVGGNTIAVAVIHDSDDALTSTPVLILPSLPGETPISDAALYAESPLADDHDLVLVDPRGGGRSTPTLDCPDLQRDPTSLDLLERCREDLGDAEADLISIGTGTTVEDLEAVRQALRQGRPWRTWHVVGSGYGSQLAHRLAQTHPAGVESLTLMSVIPPGEPYLTARARSFGPALDAITGQCEQDRNCSRLGSTTAAVNRIAGRLDTAPEPLEIPRLDGTDRGDVVSFDDSLARITMWRALREPDLAALLPWATDRIDDAASEFGMALSGRETLAAMRAATVRDEQVSQPVFWTLACSEQVARMDPALLTDITSAARELVAPVAPVDACAIWNVPMAIPPILENPVRADTLIVTSPTDPSSMREWADTMAAGIERSRVIELTTLGRTATVQECEGALIRAFVADPRATPEVSCAGGAPAFTTRPVPIAGATFHSIADEAGAVAAQVVGTLVAVVFALWVLGGPPGAAKVAWAATAGGTLVFLLAAGTVLVTADQPGRLVAQPGATWAVFLLPWVTAMAWLVALGLTAKAFWDGRLRSPWPARHALTGFGVAVAWAGAASAGMIPGI